MCSSYHSPASRNEALKDLATIGRLTQDRSGLLGCLIFTTGRIDRAVKAQRALVERGYVLADWSVAGSSAQFVYTPSQKCVNPLVHYMPRPDDIVLSVQSQENFPLVSVYVTREGYRRYKRLSVGALPRGDRPNSRVPYVTEGGRTYYFRQYPLLLEYCPFPDGDLSE